MKLGESAPGGSGVPLHWALAQRALALQGGELLFGSEGREGCEERALAAGDKTESVAGCAKASPGWAVTILLPAASAAA